ARTLLRVRGVRLSQAIDLLAGRRDLPDPATLLLRRPGDLADAATDLVRTIRDCTKLLGNDAGQCTAIARTADRILDQLRRRACRLGAAERERAHLLRDNGKAATGLAGPRRFHGGVQIGRAHV